MPEFGLSLFVSGVTSRVYIRRNANDSNRAHRRYLLVSLFAMLLALTTTSCDLQNFNGLVAPEAETAFAREYLWKLKSGDLDHVEGLLGDEMRAQLNAGQLAQMSSLFYAGEPRAVEPIGSDVKVLNKQWYGNFTFEYQFDSGWNVANVALRKVGDSYEVIGLNVYQTTAAQRELNAFTLAGKSAIHYATLTAAIVVPVFILFTLVACVRTPMAKRKWQWIVLVIVGIAGVQLDWTNGHFAANLLQVQLFGGGISSAGPASPWILSASFPLGAILFWIRRKSLTSSGNDLPTNG